MTDFNFLKAILFLGCFFCSLPFFAQGKPGEHHPTLTVTSSGSLEFGKFSRQNGGNIIIGTDGVVNKTGDIFLVNSFRSNVSFEISTNRGNNNIVTVTAFPTPLAGPAGSLELTVFFDKESYFVDKDIKAYAYMGGTLTVGPDDLPGFYTGTVSVIFAYQ